MFNVLIFRPFISVSCIKSIDHVILGPIGRTRGSFTLAGNLFCVYVLCSYPKPGKHDKLFCGSIYDRYYAGDDTSSKNPSVSVHQQAW